MREIRPFYIVVSAKEDGFWTPYKRSYHNPQVGDGFISRDQCIAALNANPITEYRYRYRIVEIPTTTEVFRITRTSRTEYV